MNLYIKNIDLNLNLNQNLKKNFIIFNYLFLTSYNFFLVSIGHD